MTPGLQPPPEVLQQSDKEIAIWALKEFERRTETDICWIVGNHPLHYFIH